jgi:aminoglycoside phosphotransferase (APT) family kinase protein
MLREETPTRPPRRDLDIAAAALEPRLCRTLGRTELRIISVRMPSGSGVANETLLVDTQEDSGAGGYVVRIDSPDEHLLMGMDIAVHYRCYQAAAAIPGMPVPHMPGFAADASLLGNRFFLMERVEGQVPPDRPNFHFSGWVTELAPARRTMWRGMIEAMTALHTADPKHYVFLERPALGRSGLEQEFRH